MRCPHGEHELRLVHAGRALDMRRVARAATFQTACCGGAVHVTPVLGHRVERASRAAA